MRHERYAAATALLGESGFATRVGGFNALVRLADEWLADERTPEEQRLAEAQVIIDTFCACIYAPFLPASRHKDYMRLNAGTPRKKHDSAPNKPNFVLRRGSAKPFSIPFTCGL